jgi:amidase
MAGMETELHRLSLTAIARMIADGELRAIDVTRTALERCSSLGPATRAIITPTAELALASADAADRRRASGAGLGPLHGVPITVKDMFDIEGLPTTAGMPARLGHVAATTATVVERLQAAGAIVIGKANVAEGVYGKYVEPFGEPVNPWNPAYWAGASSGGSGVAVAAGLGWGSIGSDTGGSIRMPSALNGITGLKPTWGRVSRHGTFELAGTLDHMGPMARSAEDAARLFQVIAGRCDRDPTSLLDPLEDVIAGLTGRVAGLTIGRPVNWLADGVDPQVLAAHEATMETLAGLGARVVDTMLPDDTDLVAAWFDVSTAQIALVHTDFFAAHEAGYSPALAAAIRHGQAMRATTLQAAQTLRAAFSGRLRRVFDAVDAILLPVFPFAAPTRAAMDAMDDATIFALHRYVCPFTMSGAPAIAFPVGQDRHAMPIGLQLIGPHLAEGRLLRIIHAFQSATDHHLRMPPAPFG